jgi:hypothetical protein
MNDKNLLWGEVSLPKRGVGIKKKMPPKDNWKYPLKISCPPSLLNFPNIFELKEAGRYFVWPI